MPSIGNITFACKDPDRLADFWAEALGYIKPDAPPGLLEALEKEGKDLNMASAIEDPDGKGPRLFFQKKQKTITEVIPIHLDVHVDDRDEVVERLVKLGAVFIKDKTETIGTYTSKWTVMKDPGGNGFCLEY